jgi:UDPglucose 6-dehydrogenase
MTMKIVIIGCGHVGLVTGACLAEIGHDVVGVDSDPERLAMLRAGRAPFFEPGLQELLERHCGERLGFDGDVARAVQGADAIFICVNTPPRDEGRLSLVYVEQAARTIAQAVSGPAIVVEKSTVPVRTSWRIVDVLKEAGRYPEVEVVCNPEFLREGSAVQDFLHPDRIVVGVNGGARARDVMTRMYAPVVERTGARLLFTDVNTAEIIKHSCNGFLAMKVSFINAVAQICERVGADVDLVAEGMGLDPRIGPEFLRAGVGYGGSCFPKDVAAFIRQANDVGMSFGLLEEVHRINGAQRQALIQKLHRAVWNTEGKTIAIWGLAFKPGTDDLREAPANDIIAVLLAEGARVRAYDPVAGPAAKAAFADIDVIDDALEVADGADALVVLTEWPEFAGVDLGRLRSRLARPVVIDGRNVWPVEAMAEAGFTYLSFGRPDVVVGEIRRP